MGWSGTQKRKDKRGGWGVVVWEGVGKWKEREEEDGVKEEEEKKKRNRENNRATGQAEQGDKQEESGAGGPDEIGAVRRAGDGLGVRPQSGEWSSGSTGSSRGPCSSVSGDVAVCDESIDRVTVVAMVGVAPGGSLGFAIARR
jgi:hypothetical protein